MTNDFKLALGGMVAIPQWFVWKLQKSKPGSLKYDLKTPVSSSGANIDAQVSENWQTFEHALMQRNAMRLREKGSAKYTLGFMFTQDCGFWFYDIDGCVEGGAANHHVATEYAALTGCFFEYSSSETGVHFIGRNTQGVETGKNADGVSVGRTRPVAGHANNIEFYTQSRGVAFGLTDVAYGCADVAAPQGWIDNMINVVLAEPVRQAVEGDYIGVHDGEGPREDWDGPEDDAELIALMYRAKPSANNMFEGTASFVELFEGNHEALCRAFGDGSDTGYDRSRADMALASHLSFYTGADAERVERIMRMSALVRPKWDDRDDYLSSRTIGQVVRRQGSVYNSGFKKSADLEKALAASPVLLAEELVTLEDLNPCLSDTADMDHFDSAKMIDYALGKRLVNMAGLTHWWNGRCFEAADDSLIKRYVARMLSGAVSAGRVEGVCKLLANYIDRLPPANPPTPFVFWRDTVMGIDGSKQPHAREFLNSRTLTVDHTDAKPNAWLEYLDMIFIPGDGRKELLQEIMGWCLTRDSLNIQKLIMLIGPPRAGKGIIVDIIKSTLGSGASTVDLTSSFIDNKALSSLRHSNVAIDSDASTPRPQDARVIAGVLKRVTANESISIPLLYNQTPWEGSLNCKVLIAVNSVPRFFDDSGAMGNRWIPLVFNKSFLGKEDPNLPAMLKKELPEIAAWAFEGLQNLSKRGRFVLPQSSIDEMASIADDNPLTDFLSNSVLIDADGLVVGSELYSAYSGYQIMQQQPVPSMRTFYRSVSDTLRGDGVIRKKTKVGVVFEGIKRVV